MKGMFSLSLLSIGQVDTLSKIFSDRKFGRGRDDKRRFRVPFLQILNFGR